MHVVSAPLDGQKLSTSYLSAAPFPHILLKDFWDSRFLAEVSAQTKAFCTFAGEKDFHGARKKRYCGDYDRLPIRVQQLIDFCHEPSFLRFLEELTGESDLVADPGLEGGGIHSISEGGFLKVHSDFNWHNGLQLYRRLNMLVYLNPDWREEYGGHLELWERDMSKRARSVAPELNTTVIFTTDDTSYHGHPNPLTTPPHVSRDSIALYYYSAKRPDDESRKMRKKTAYRARAGTDFDVRIPVASTLRRAGNAIKRLLRPR